MRPVHIILSVVITMLASTPRAGATSVAREWNEQLLAAIRLSIPNPPAHARNLFHTGTAMFDAWATYDTTSVGYLTSTKVTPLPSDIELARREAISYAAYRVLRARFTGGQNASTILTNFDNKLIALGYSTATAQSAVTSGTTPAEVGKRIGQAVLDWSSVDGFSSTTYPQAYTSAVNPNMDYPMSVLGQNLAFQFNVPLGFGVPAGTDPNLWQPLDLATSVTQNGIPIPGGPQGFLGVQSLATTPFSLTRTDNTKPWLDPFGGPSRINFGSFTSPTDAACKAAALSVVTASSQLNDITQIDISPATLGNNPLGSDSGTGYAANPVAGGSYTSTLVKRGDFTRVLAEFWADGPNSETPPGHWHVLANQVSDNPALVKRIGGIGPVVNDLEWDVKVYFSLASAVHDAACAAWSLKRYYSGTRPITLIRYLGSNGLLPLQTGVAEVITSTTAAIGGRHRNIYDMQFGSTRLGTNFIGQIAVFSWPAEHPNNLPAPSIASNQTPVQWMLARDWVPFQRKTFNTPAFPGYVSGHSTFSRAAAEVLTRITGSPYFPGGYHHHTFTANTMQIDRGPSTNVDLQWVSYYDAADQAGQSRRYGGIHVSEDDFHGRVIGSSVGISAYALAEKYFTGAILSEPMRPQITPPSSNSLTFRWTALRGMYQKVQVSTDLVNWTDLTTSTRAYDTKGSLTDNTATGPTKFYRVICLPSP